MYIIAGLGNPGKEYENTRHNIGFDVIDRLAEEENIAVMESKHKALIGKGYVAGQKVILAKPQTFMNLSGESIREIVDYYKVDDTSELIVISDEWTRNILLLYMMISAWMWDRSASAKRAAPADIMDSRISSRC